MKTAASLTSTIIPKATAEALSLAAMSFPKPARVFGESAVLQAARHIPEAVQNMNTIAPARLLKAGSAGFFDELEKMASAGLIDEVLLEKAASIDVDEMVKAALNLPNMGNVGGALRGAAGSVGKAMGGALQGARGGIANVAGKISPTLNKPVMQAAQGAAHSLQHSPNAFAQGVGNVLHHKTMTPTKAMLGAMNPVGTAAEALTAGAGNAASKGLANVGGRLQSAFKPADAVVAQGRAMTPKGRLMNAAGALGGRVQSSFSPGGTGHNVLTKHLPMAGEIGGAVGAGMMLHAPVGLAGVAGKLGLMGAGKAVPAIGAALEHAPHAVDALAHKVAPALKGVGEVLHHGAEDVVGTLKQNFGERAGGRLLGGGAQVARHSMIPAAPVH